MKARVKLSRFSIILTTIINVALYIGCFVTLKEPAPFFCLLGIITALLITGLLFAPVSIKADDHTVTVAHILRKTKIAMTDVASVERFQPTMGAIRICASGGYMGYWGLFRESDIGHYTAYYGKSSDCFLIVTRSGRKYVLGCADPDSMVAYIRERIKS